MKCPRCGFEPYESLLSQPCPICGNSWWDTSQYVEWLTQDTPVKTALDIGCGNKGIIAQHVWENVKKISRGYACDRHVVKTLPKQWRTFIADAEDLPELLPELVDVTTHCGLLEHIPYEKAFRVMHAIERVTRTLVFMSCSAELRAVDYKVERDGNPFHYYRSFWDADTLEALGYTVDRQRMANKTTFDYEVVAWLRTDQPREPWPARVRRARAVLGLRRCGVTGCLAEPFVWDVHTNSSYCLVHAYERRLGADSACASWKWWLERDDISRFLAQCTPPWREERLAPRLSLDVEGTKA